MRERRRGGSRRGPLKENMKTFPWMKKIISFLTVICCLGGSLGPLDAEAAESTAEKTVPTIVFENEPVESDSLSVTKTVTGLNNAEIPKEVREEVAETEFWFWLTLDGKAAANKKYHVYSWKINEDGTRERVERYANEPVNGNVPELYRTDREGRFFLKAGWTAEFLPEDVRELREGAEYRVTEEQKEGYRQAKPEEKDGEQNAYASGTLTGIAAAVSFTNEYVPQGTGTGDAVLEVRKTVAPVLGKTGYVLPGNPDFTFRLTLNGRPFQGRYQLWDTDTGEEITDKDYTANAEGIFTLKANQKAVFSEPDVNGRKITTGMQYEVRELNLPEDWRVIGSTGLTDKTEQLAGYTTDAIKMGKTVSWTMLEFTNAEASFGVSKETEPGYEADPEAEFTFELRHGDSTLWQGAKYYLFDTGTKQLLIGDENRNPEEGGSGPAEALPYRITDEKGQFTLKFGQTAVFVGIDTKEQYSVREVARNPEEEKDTVEGDSAVSPVAGKRFYTQSYPLDRDGRPVGYTNTTGSISEWKFRNRPLDGLTVTKRVEKENGEAPANSDTEFCFTIYKVDPDGSQTPQKAYYTIGESGHDTRDGTFRLKADETASFPYLAPGTYKIVEDVTGTPQYSVVPASDREGNAKTTQEQTGTLTAGGSLAFTFKNYFVPHKLDLRMVKVDENGERLPGARFMLFRDEDGTNPVVPGGGEAEPGKTAGSTAGSTAESREEDTSPTAGINGKFAREDSPATGPDGTVTFEGLQAGTVYYLKEVVAPGGYLVLPDMIKIEVTGEADGSLKAVVDDGKYDKDIVGSIQVNDKDDVVEITIINSKIYELPSTGGRGIYWYLTGGILLMLAASLVSYKNKHR